jgi:hypothetical protein
MTIAPFRPKRSTTRPAMAVVTRPVTAFRVSSMVICVNGVARRCRRYSVRKGQTMLPPVALIHVPQNSSQNAGG